MSDFLVLGAGGMLGSDVVREFQSRGMNVTGLNRFQCDVTSPSRCLEVLTGEQPRAVINCAACTDVDGAEADPAGAFAINAEGAANVAVACASVGARCFYLSTDYIFDGSKTEPYLETDEPAPVNAYGQSKLAGEQRTAALAPAHCIVRTSWLYGRNGRNFVTAMLQRAQTCEPVRVVNDQHGSPTSTVALSRCIAQLVASEAHGILHATSAGECTWYEFAQSIFELSGFHPARVETVSTAEFPRPARRPANSRLANNRMPEFGIQPLPHWRDSLSEYVQSLQLERC